RLEWAGLALGLGGVVMLNAGGDLAAQPVYALALLLGPSAWAFGSVWGRRLPLPKGLMGAAAQMMGGGAIMVIFSLLIGERIHHLPPASATWSLAYLMVFGSIVGFTAYDYLLRHTRPSVATSYAYVNPAVAVALGVGLAGEHVHAKD